MGHKQKLRRARRCPDTAIKLRRVDEQFLEVDGTRISLEAVRYHLDDENIDVLGWGQISRNTGLSRRQLQFVIKTEQSSSWHMHFVNIGEDGGSIHRYPATASNSAYAGYLCHKESSQ